MTLRGLIDKSLATDTVLIREAVRDIPKEREKANSDFETEKLLLDGEYKNRLRALYIWYRGKREGIAIRHNRKLRKIDLQ